jgi:peptidoglycan/LPS O-acetylase OafA/YrhL
MSPTSSGTPVAARFYLPELDAIRFVAFLLVFLSHVVPGEPEFYRHAGITQSVATAIVSLAAGGAFGVDLFFALSAFLITTLLLREQQVSGNIDVASFYWRRILRIWPLYFTFLLLLAPWVRRFLPGDTLPTRDVIAFALMVGNWAFVLWGYARSSVGPLWSVSVEEQFYLAWPLVLRRFSASLPGALLAIWGVSIATRTALVLAGAAHPQIWCNTMAHLDPIAGGGLLAVVFNRQRIALPTWARVALLCCGVGIFALAGRYGDFAGPRALVTYPVVALSSCLFIAASLRPRIDLAQQALVRPVLYLGKISYGLYVFHLMFIMLLGVGAAQTPGRRALLICVALLCSVAAAATSYHILERPFLALKARFTHIASRPL